ncbi:MAG: phosphatidylserine decarboxylase [Clostridia bacterium]|nr:phosphatidylserine decarboxylase [Clostridia bacterium]
MSDEVKGYGWRPVVKADLGNYRPQSAKVMKGGLFVRAEIKSHMEKYGVKLSECQPSDVAAFESFADYLSRAFAEGARPVDTASNSLIAPCDGYITAHFINSMGLIPVGNHMYSVRKLLGGDSRAKDFNEGMALILRLDEGDPHRFVYPDDGACGDRFTLAAEKDMEDSMFFSARSCTFMDMKHFFGMAQVETCGNAKGVEQFAGDDSLVFVKGQEKGRFLCGDAGILMLFKKGMMFPDDEIMVNTREGLETRVRQGEKIGIAIAVG